MSPTTIGIDLGSTNIRCGRAEYQGLKQPRIVPIGDSFEGIPTAFTITEPNYTHKIGADALDNNPSNIIFDSASVLYPSKATKGSDGANIYAKLHERRFDQYYVIQAGQNEFKFSVSEVVGEILNGIKLMAESELGCSVTRAVLTVPSMAGTAHRRMLQHASKIAGLETKLINQSTAAALTFRLNTGAYAEGTVLVFSMGARTTECSIFEFANYQTPKTPKLCQSDGYFDFGGESFTDCLADEIIKHLSIEYKEKFDNLRKQWARDPEGEKVFKGKLRKEAEKAKAGLMELEKISILLEPDAEFGACKISLTRSQFYAICSNLVEKMKKLIGDVLKFCPKGKPIGHVMLAGASSKLFIVSELLKYHLPDTTFIKMDAVPPGLAAVRGAAIGAALWEAKSGSGPIPPCLRHLDMPDFVYHRLEAKQSNETRLVVADVSMEMPTRPIQIISEQQSSRWSYTYIELFEVCGRKSAQEAVQQKIGQINLYRAESVFLSLDENGLVLEFESPEQTTKSSWQWDWFLKKYLLTDDGLERASQKMGKYNERIRKETEEAKRKGDEESRRMLELERMKEEQEEEEKRMREEEEKRRKKELELEEKRRMREEEEKRRKELEKKRLMMKEEEEKKRKKELELEEKRMRDEEEKRRKELEKKRMMMKEEEEKKLKKELELEEKRMREEEEKRRKELEKRRMMMKEEEEKKRKKELQDKRMMEEEEKRMMMNRKKEEQKLNEGSGKEGEKVVHTTKFQQIPLKFTFSQRAKPRCVLLFGSWGDNGIECELMHVDSGYFTFTSTWTYGANISLNPGNYTYVFWVDDKPSDTFWVQVHDEQTVASPIQGTSSSTSIESNQSWK